MEVPSPDLAEMTWVPTWVRLAPCERAALQTLRDALHDRERDGGRLALEGLGLFSLRHGDAFEVFLSPGAAVALAAHLTGLSPTPSDPPPDAPGVKLEEGDPTLWVTVVRGLNRRPEA
jgi:hypothetical protein